MSNLDPTYLRYIYDNLIKGSVHLENSSELPEGLIGLYEEAFEEHLPVIQRQQLLQRFALFALLKKEVSIHFVSDVLNESEADILEFINKYAFWFNSPEPGKFQLYHERLKVYLLQKLSEKEIQTLHEKLIARLEQAIEEQKADEFEWYGLEFLAGHLGVSGIINVDKRLFNFGRRVNFESRQIEISEGFEWSKSLYKNCIETSTISDKENVIEWGLKLHLINQAEQKDWSLINRHFDLGEISRFESELEEKINQFSFVSDNYLSYPTLLTYAYYFRLIENESIQRLNKERLFDLLNKSVEKHAIYLFDFPRLHLVIIERFYTLGFDVSFLIKKFNFQMSSDDAQKCLFPSDFLLHGVYDNIFILLKVNDINEGDFFKSFLHIGFKYSTENLEEIIKLNGLLNFDKSILEHRIKHDLNPVVLIEILTKAVETNFDSFFSLEELPRNKRNFYELIEFALINRYYFNPKKWEQFAKTYLRKSDDFDYRAINLLNLVKDIPDDDLIQIAHKAINTNEDARVSIFFGYLIKLNKIDLIQIIIEKASAGNTNLVFWNFLIENNFNLKLLLESQFIESKELKRIWLVNTIRYFRSQISSKKFIEFCIYSESSIVEIDQPKMKLDYWFPESILTGDFNIYSGITINSKDIRLNTVNNLEFVFLLIAQSDVFDQDVELYLKYRIKELIDRKITYLRNESIKSIYSFLLKHSTNHFNIHFVQLIKYLNRLPTNEKYLNSFSFIYELFEREGFKYKDVRLTNYFYKAFSYSNIPRQPDSFGELLKLSLNKNQKKNIYISYIKYSCLERWENIINLTSFNYGNDLLIESSLTVFETMLGERLAEILGVPWWYSEFVESIKKIGPRSLEKIQNLINIQPGYPWDQLSQKELIQTYSKLYTNFNSKQSLENSLIGFLMSSLTTSNEYEEFAFHYKLNSKKSRKKSIDKLKSPYFADYPDLYRGVLSSLINISIDDKFDKFEGILPNHIIKPKNFSDGLKAMQFLIKSIFPLERLNVFLIQNIDKYITNIFETLFGYINNTSIKSETEESDFEKAIEDLAESENIVLLLYCSLLIQISNKKHEKRVGLIKKVVSELAKVGYNNFSHKIDDYTEDEGDLIFLTYCLVTAYIPPKHSENKLLNFIPWRTKFIFIFSELLKKERVVSSKTKKSALGFIDYCLSKKLSIPDLTRLYNDSMSIDSKDRANKIINKILSQIEPDEDEWNIREILLSCIKYEDSRNIKLLINSKKEFIHFDIADVIKAKIILGEYDISNYENDHVRLNEETRLKILSDLILISHPKIIRTRILPEIDLYLYEHLDSELIEDYLVDIGCLLFDQFGIDFSSKYVCPKSQENNEIFTYYISVLIKRNNIKEVDSLILKSNLKNLINTDKILSDLLRDMTFELGNMEKLILKFFKQNSEKCLKVLISNRKNDNELSVLLCKFKYGVKESHILLRNLDKFHFSFDKWIIIINRIPSRLRKEFINKLISTKKSQITISALNLLQDNFSIRISPENIIDLVSNYAVFKQWKQIDRILKWLKTQHRIKDIQELLALAYDKNWDTKMSVFLNLLGKKKTLETLKSRTILVNTQVIDLIERISDIPRHAYHVHPDYFEKLRNDLDKYQIIEIIENIKSRKTEAGYCEVGSFSNLYWTRMNVTEINRYVSMYYDNREALELLASNFKIISELEDEKKYTELLNKFDVNYAKFDVEL